MPDLNQRFRGIDRLSPPDLLSEARVKAEEASSRRSGAAATPMRRLATIVVALAFGLSGVAALFLAFGRDEQRTEPGAAATAPPDAEIEEFLCAEDVNLQDALPPTDDPKMVGVYLSCGADAAVLGTDQQPVYLAMREIPTGLADTPEGRLEGAVREYIAGPTSAEQDRGYFTAAPAALADAIKEISIDGTMAIIDFSAEVANQLGNLGATTATDVFVNELAATVFQFDGIDQLALQLEGDCEQFWRLLERTCTDIKRT